MKNYFIASEKSVTATVENCDTNKLGGSVNISVSQNKIVWEKKKKHIPVVEFLYDQNHLFYIPWYTFK